MGWRRRRSGDRRERRHEGWGLRGQLRADEVLVWNKWSHHLGSEDALGRQVLLVGVGAGDRGLPLLLPLRLLLRIKIHDLVKKLRVWASPCRLHLHEQVTSTLQIGSRHGCFDHEGEGALRDLHLLLAEVLMKCLRDAGGLEAEGALEDHLGLFVGLRSNFFGDLDAFRGLLRTRRGRGRNSLLHQEMPLGLLVVEGNVVHQTGEVHLRLSFPNLGGLGRRRRRSGDERAFGRWARLGSAGGFLFDSGTRPFLGFAFLSRGPRRSWSLCASNLHCHSFQTVRRRLVRHCLPVSKHPPARVAVGASWLTLLLPNVLILKKALVTLILLLRPEGFEVDPEKDDG
mmetsp:Transcript_35758/g.77302  ORF Transcript_35758/g.77302 Transcript_35758/m.77302 type:complete len:342 (+) Transcript_35758:823-1848(+)